MKKTTTAFLFLLALCSSQANAQLSSLFKKKDKIASSGASSGGKEQLMEDEPGTIFGNYYYKVIYGKSDKNDIYGGYAKATELKALGSTMQLKRYEAGKDNNIRISMKGISRAEYSYNNNVCGGCEQTNQGGYLYYMPMDYFALEETKASTKTEWFLKGYLRRIEDGVLAIDITGVEYRGAIILSKDKSKLDLITEENAAAYGKKGDADYIAAVKNADKGEKMPKAGAALKASVFATANKAAVTQLKAKLIEMGYSHLVPVYAYEINGTPTFSPKYNNVQQEVARTAGFYVVCKNNKVVSDNSPGKFEYKTKYVVFIVDMKEDGSGNSFSGKPYMYQPVSMCKPIDDAENAMMYK
jgi:hypothetical protein